MIYNECCISFDLKRILLVKKGDVWILPGGKQKEGEENGDALLREIKEELPEVKVEKLVYYKDFYGFTPHKKRLVCFVYKVELSGSTNVVAREISEARYVSRKEIKSLNISEMTEKIIKFLIKKHYL